MEFISKEPIYKGFSIDKKFRAKDCQGHEYLLRIAPAECYQRRKQDYEYMLRFLSLGIPMCMPLEFGICNEGVYSVQKWIDGIDLQEVISQLSDDKQYTYGMEAGRALKQLHKFPVPDHLDCWESIFRQKMNSTIEHYQKSTVQFSNSQIMIDFIQENIHYSAGRPRVYLHGDYHIGNLMLGADNKLYIIDFSNDICCDPWEDFGSISVSAYESYGFACGMIDGYFDRKIPEQFWKLLALYTCYRILSFFAAPTHRIQNQNYQEKILSLAEKVLQWYDNMTLAVPIWYDSNRKR